MQQKEWFFFSAATQLTFVRNIWQIESTSVIRTRITMFQDWIKLASQPLNLLSI